MRARETFYLASPDGGQVLIPDIERFSALTLLLSTKSFCVLPTIDARYLWQTKDGEVIIVRNARPFGALVPTFQVRNGQPLRMAQYRFLSQFGSRSKTRRSRNHNVQQHAVRGALTVFTLMLIPLMLIPLIDTSVASC
jgi:hypothetical protein